MWEGLSVLRYPIDYWLTARCCPIVVMAHNPLPHNRGDDAGVVSNIRLTMRNAAAILADSLLGKAMLAKIFGAPEGLIEVIPLGNHAVTAGAPCAWIAVR